MTDDAVKAAESGSEAISEADRLKLSKWKYAPSDELYLKYKKVFDTVLIGAYIIKKRFKGKFKVLMIILEIVIFIGLITVLVLFWQQMPELLRKILFFSLKGTSK